MIDVVPNAGVIALGKQGENQAVRVTLPNIRAGAGSILLLHQRSDDQKPYPVPVVEADGGIIWTVSSTDTAYPGRGQAELQWLGTDGAVVKSVTYQTNVLRALTTPGAVPDEPLKPYTQAVAKDAQAARDAAASATEAARSAGTSATQAGLSAENAAKSLKKLEDGIASGDFRGQDGKSAYQLAVDAGFDGTETQWLESLKGAPGDTTAADAAAAAAQKSAEDAQKNATAAQTAAQEAQKAAETAVLYTEQNLTDSQQEQARANIGAADKARQNILVGMETGNPIAVDDAFSAPLCGLTVYGKSTQDGTPSPDSPVPIVSAGDGGSVAVTLSDGNGKTQTLTLPTPNGLPGIPVTSGGNYTDENGQRWICDEIDLTRGVRVQRNDSFAISSENARNIVIMNDFTKVTVATSARIKAPKQTDKSEALGRNLFCEALPWERDVWASRKNGMGFSENNYIDFAIENSYLGLNEASTNDERKTALVKYFTDNPCQVVYRIATPIETPLTSAEIATYKALITYAPDTVVQASDGAGVKLDYQRDVNIAIKKLEDAVASMTAN